MSLEPLVDIVHSRSRENWNERNRDALKALFGSRYPVLAEKEINLRAPKPENMEAPFAAYIKHGSPDSGAYPGLSFVLFPGSEVPCLFGLVVGTRGLGDDHTILARPGHARKCQAISSWLNAKFGGGELVSWAKHDPTRTDIDASNEIAGAWPGYEASFRVYGSFMYAMFRPNGNRDNTRTALAALLDLLFDERGFKPLKKFEAESESIRTEWLDYLMPKVDEASVHRTLQQRRYVILQGPPGTGKTRMATLLRENAYGGNGRTVQFHPNTTYESFIGGLTPITDSSEMGLRFKPSPGFLLDAAREAANQPDRDYLLHIDEINRADLGKVLGEAIYLLEVKADTPRDVSLTYEFPGISNPFSLPPNLHILGTMNSADRSIALVDVAVRRRFGFISMWPRASVVSDLGGPLAEKAFRRLLSLFVEHAPDDVFPLVPGHSYFLERDDQEAAQSLNLNLAPLLEEYLAQGYVSGFSESIRSYLQWLKALRRASEI